jgi:hypothetical protein
MNMEIWLLNNKRRLEMSIFSDHKVGALSDWEFEQECRRMNREEREYIDDFERYAEEEDDGEGEED